MKYCQIAAGGSRELAIGGERLKVATVTNISSHGGSKTLALVSVGDCSDADNIQTVCVDRQQADIKIPLALQMKLKMVGYTKVRCTGTGHDAGGQYREDGFTINGRNIGGRQAFFSLAELDDPEVTINVLPEGTEVISTFVAHPKEQVSRHNSPYSPNVTRRVVPPARRDSQTRELETVGA